MVLGDFFIAFLFCKFFRFFQGFFHLYFIFVTFFFAHKKIEDLLMSVSNFSVLVIPQIHFLDFHTTNITTQVVNLFNSIDYLKSAQGVYN